MPKEGDKKEKSKNLNPINSPDPYPLASFNQLSELLKENPYKSEKNSPSCHVDLSATLFNEEIQIQNKPKMKLNSFGVMLPDPRRRSKDQRDSSDFMIIRDYCIAVADGVS